MDTELDRINLILKQREERSSALLKYGKGVRARISREDNTDGHALMLADICVELDVRFNNSPLTLEWMLDYYVALEFERRAYPRFLEIWKKLSAEKRNYRNPFEYFNGAAFYIPCATKRVCVYGSPYADKPRYLVVDDINDDGPLRVWRNFYVRNIWPKTVLNCIGSIERPTLSHFRRHGFEVRNAGPGFYGDCRDPGHVMTYERIGGRYGKADHVMWDLNAPLRWFFETSCLWSEAFG